MNYSSAYFFYNSINTRIILLQIYVKTPKLMCKVFMLWATGIQLAELGSFG